MVSAAASGGPAGRFRALRCASRTRQLSASSSLPCALSDRSVLASTGPYATLCPLPCLCRHAMSALCFVGLCPFAPLLALPHCPSPCLLCVTVSLSFPLSLSLSALRDSPRPFHLLLVLVLVPRRRRTFRNRLECSRAFGHVARPATRRRGGRGGRGSDTERQRQRAVDKRSRWRHARGGHALAADAHVRHTRATFVTLAR